MAKTKEPKIDKPKIVKMTDGMIDDIIDVVENDMSYYLGHDRECVKDELKIFFRNLPDKF